MSYSFTEQQLKLQQVTEHLQQLSQQLTQVQQLQSNQQLTHNELLQQANHIQQQLGAAQLQAPFNNAAAVAGQNIPVALQPMSAGNLSTTALNQVNISHSLETESLYTNVN